MRRHETLSADDVLKAVEVSLVLDMRKMKLVMILI